MRESVSNGAMVTTPPSPSRPRTSRISNFLQGRWRILFAAIVSGLLIVLLPHSYRLDSRMLIGWDAGVALYLVLVAVMISRSSPGQLRLNSAQQDMGRIAIPILTVGAAMASLGAIISWMRTTSATGVIEPRILVLLFLTTVLSWLFLHIMFALHYAHEYYADHRGRKGGLRFPGGGEPGYTDFIYFAFTIGTSTEVSDVAIISPAIRKTVTIHSVISFLFNVTMIALTVSIAGNAITMK